MNQIEGEISEIISSDHMSLVFVDLGFGIIFQSILLDTASSASYLQKGKKINILFKETELVICKNVNIEISLENQIRAKIREINKGPILTRVQLESEIGSLIALISTNSCELLGLKAGDEVLNMVKFNEVILSPI